MAPKVLLFVITSLFCFGNASAAGYSIKPDSGVILVWEHGKGSWIAVKDSAPISAGDSLYLDDQYHARLFLGTGCTVLLRGELRANLAGSDTALTVHVDAGQLFLRREPGAALANIKAVLRGCSFTPVGTAASFKFTRQGEPTVAVLAGKIRIEPPKGEPVMVLPGAFCTYDPATAALKQGKVPAEAIAALENWSGAKLDMSAATASVDTAKQAVKDTTHKAQPAAAQTTPKAAPVQPATVASPTPTQPASAAQAAQAKQASAEPAAQPKKEEKPAQASAAPAPPPQQENPSQTAQPAKKQQPKSQDNGSQKITWELSASSVTVGNEQWTRLAFSPDIPIWKFGIGLDVELFLNARGDFSNKAWNFDRDNWLESVTRKIKYLRFGYENDPVFVKVGGLSNVTLGYGFIMDRFTNMLHYPDEKLLGLQFCLNNISPVGITLQAMAPDLLEFRYKNDGIAAARLALCPVKPANIPILSNLSIGATYAIDRNQYAPARSWTSNGNPLVDSKGVYYASYWRSKYPAWFVDTLITHGDADTTALDTTYRDSTSQYALLGGDIGIPIVKTDFFGLDVYGQAAIVADSATFKQDRTGWGFGAPGVALRVGPVNAQVEYRHTQGRFAPGYFGPYYFDERLQRYPEVETKSQTLASTELNGVFGELGFNIVNVVLINGSYQYLGGKNNQKDQRLELSGGLGDALLKRIPKISKAEVYLDKRDIGSTVMGLESTGSVRYDAFFDLTPSFYYGYRIGVAITQGASLIWDARFGYQWDINHNLVPNNNVSIRTAITF